MSHRIAGPPSYQRIPQTKTTVLTSPVTAVGMALVPAKFITPAATRARRQSPSLLTVHVPIEHGWFHS